MVSKGSLKLCLPFGRNSTARRLYSWPGGKHQRGDLGNAALTSASILVVKASFCSAEKTWKCLQAEVDPPASLCNSKQPPFPPPALVSGTRALLASLQLYVFAVLKVGEEWGWLWGVSPQDCGERRGFLGDCTPSRGRTWQQSLADTQTECLDC